MIDLNELKKECVEIQDKRIANGAKFAGGILKHLATEVVEAAEARQKISFWAGDFKSVVSCKNDYAEELADIIICALIAAADDDIDIEKAVIGKIEKNRQRAEMQGDKL